MTKKQFFVKKLEFALKISRTPMPVFKKYYICCPDCDGGKSWGSDFGYRVYSDQSRTQLKKQGIMVSALGFYEDIKPGPYPRAEDDGRCLLCEGWGCIDCRYTGGY